MTRPADSDLLQDQMISVMHARAAVVAMAGAVVDASESGVNPENLKALIAQMGVLLGNERTERKAFADLADRLSASPGIGTSESANVPSYEAPTSMVQE